MYDILAVFVTGALLFVAMAIVATMVDRKARIDKRASR